MDGQRAVKTFALDSGGFGYFGDALGLGQVTQGDQEDAGLVFVFQGGYEEEEKSKSAPLKSKGCGTQNLQMGT